MQIPEVAERITNLSDPEGEAFIVYLAREGPMINLHGGIYNELGLNIPYTTAHARHEKADNKFGRVAYSCDINFEGLNPNQAELLIIADNTASGMQHFTVIEKAIWHIDGNNDNHKKLKEVMVVSPLLTKYSVLAISQKCASLGLPVSFVCSGFLLDCIGPHRYFSPIPDNEKYAADDKMLLLNRFIMGDLVGKICSRCNWTASFSAARAAFQSSQEELSELGIANEMLIKICEKITPKLLQQMGIDPKKLIPYSSLREAENSSLLNVLVKSVGE